MGSVSGSGRQVGGVSVCIWRAARQQRFGVHQGRDERNSGQQGRAGCKAASPATGAGAKLACAKACRLVRATARSAFQL